MCQPTATGLPHVRAEGILHTGRSTLMRSVSSSESDHQVLLVMNSTQDHLVVLVVPTPCSDVAVLCAGPDGSCSGLSGASQASACGPVSQSSCRARLDVLSSPIGNDAIVVEPSGRESAGVRMGFSRGGSFFQLLH